MGGDYCELELESERQENEWQRKQIAGGRKGKEKETTCNVLGGL